jgi:glycosyltransferase involved in cell wall biosynthesis
MHICFVEDTLLYGGTQIWVTEAVEYFLSHGDQVTLLAPNGSRVVSICENTSARVLTYDWHAAPDEGSEVERVWTDALAPSDIAVCTVHPPRQGFHPSIYSAKVIRQADVSTYFVSKTGTIVPSYKREFYLPDESIPSSVVAITHFTRQYLIENYSIPEGKIELIYLGTDVGRFNLELRDRRQQSIYGMFAKDASPVLGCIGTFEKRKGQLVLLEAFSKLVLKGKLRDARLLFVGEGEDEAKIERVINSLGLEHTIKLYPFTNHPEDFYAVLDITILPSLYKEGLPNVLAESMAMGIPVIASDVGGISELVNDGETGRLITPGDSIKLADAIFEMWSDQDAYQGMRERTRKFVVENFNKEKQFRHFYECFHQLVQK